MNKLTSFVLLSFLFLLFSCKEPDTPVPQVDTGAYAKLLEKSGELVLADIPSSKVDISVEFIDGNDGNDITLYSWGVIHSQGTAEEFPLISLTPDMFGTSANGKASVDFSITFQDVLDALNYTESDVNVGDRFVFNAKLKKSDGSTFDIGNTTPNLIVQFNAFFQFEELVK